MTEAEVQAKEIKRRTKQVRIRKWGGDHRYSWALFIDNQEKYNGMDRNEAEWRRKRYINEGKL